MGGEPVGGREREKEDEEEERPKLLHILFPLSFSIKIILCKKVY